MIMNYIKSYKLLILLFSLAMLAGGIVDVLLLDAAKQSVITLGYPIYFIRILGIWKIIGSIILIIPAFKTLKEWAYAGFFINLLMASLSHISVGDPLANSIRPIIILILMFIGYYFQKKHSNLTNN